MAVQEVVFAIYFLIYFYLYSTFHRSKTALQQRQAYKIQKIKT